MPATPADIAAASRDVAVATWSSDVITARYPSARDGTVTPSDGYFDSITDASAVITTRGALIGVERRRFTVDVAGLEWPTLANGLPQVTLVDTEQRAQGGFLVARIELDLEAETTSFETFG